MTEGQAVDQIEGGTFPPPAARYRLTIIEVTSVLIVTSRKSKSVSGSMEDAAAHYRSVLTHNLLAGWWGFPFGPIWTVVALVRNRKTLAQLRKLASTGEVPAAWLRDPSGRHAQRYWDGRLWTEHVTDVSADPLGA